MGHLGHESSLAYIYLAKAFTKYILGKYVKKVVSLVKNYYSVYFTFSVWVAPTNVTPIAHGWCGNWLVSRPAQRLPRPPYIIQRMTNTDAPEAWPSDSL